MCLTIGYHILAGR
ncbi:hypothetical protein A2U01_0103404, partial [Trifolium medium]|nr:hypothetical protein [Trifolium medium]